MRPFRYLISAAVIAAVPLLALERGSVPSEPLALQAQEAVSAKTWLEQRQQIEDYIKEAEIVRMEDIGVGVTAPKRAYLADGGPVESIAWKALKPGIYRGFFESYKAEIAAYEMDKLLELEMVPVKVEKRVKGDLGVAVMWVSPTRSFKEMGGAPAPPPVHFAEWNRQIIKAKMFDNLIGNTDPNLGNWLVDPAWNLILIDHSRAFTSDRKLTHEMGRIDRDLWERMQALDEETLTQVLGPWLGRREIRAVFQRRDRMRAEIEKMVKEKGEAAVFVQ